MKSIYNLVKSKIVFNPNYPDECVRKIIQKLKKEDFEIEGSIGNYGLILKKNEKLYGVIFFDLESLHESSVLNIYRNKYYGAFLETAFIFLFDLQRNFDACVKRIVNMVNNVKPTLENNEEVVGKVKRRASRKKVQEAKLPEAKLQEAKLQEDKPEENVDEKSQDEKEEETK